MPISAKAASKDAMTWRAMRAATALMMVAFSRSRKPMRPSALEIVTEISGRLLSTIAAARSSIDSVDRREHTRDRDRLRAPAWRMLAGRIAHGALIEWRVFAAVELVAAGQLKADAADAALQVLGPATHRRQRFARRTGEAQHADLEQAFALDKRIHEMRRADHDGVRWLAAFMPRRLEHGTRRTHDAAAHVRRRRPLRRRQHGPSRDQNGVRIRPPDIDSQSHAAQSSWRGRRRRAANGMGKMRGGSRWVAPAGLLCSSPAGTS